MAQVELVTMYGVAYKSQEGKLSIMAGYLSIDEGLMRFKAQELNRQIKKETYAPIEMSIQIKELK